MNNPSTLTLELWPFSFLALCKPECVHGKCEQPNECFCEEGYRGQSCESRKWILIGYNLKSNCKNCWCPTKLDLLYDDPRWPLLSFHPGVIHVSCVSHDTLCPESIHDLGIVSWVKYNIPSSFWFFKRCTRFCHFENWTIFTMKTNIAKRGNNFEILISRILVPINHTK